jgi:hydrogenase maturation protein HypF
VLAIACDGTGYGLDGSVWGGEFLRVDGVQVERLGHVRPFLLPGGEQAIREPRRSALGVLFELYGCEAFTASEIVCDAFAADERRLLLLALGQRLNTPSTSSLGRLFDACASLLGICEVATYSEQAPVAVEGLASAATETLPYKVAVTRGRDQTLILDWQPLIDSILTDVRDNKDRRAIARGFHQALAEGLVAVTLASGIEQIVLTGGVFQNSLLTSLVEDQLAARGLKVYTHQRVPAGDGGLAAGQALYGLLALGGEEQTRCV